MARAVDIVRGHRDARLVVVVSALAGVTDALLEIATRAVQGDAEFVRAGAAAVRARHVAAAEALLAPGPRRDELLRLIGEAFAELEQIAAGLVIVRELTARTTDYLVARGERLSARLFAAALGEAGVGAVQFVDAPEVVKSDGTFGHASPDLARTDRAARKVLGPLLARGAVPVVPGFLAATPDGQVATLGRGGSDLTATLLGRALGARDVALWKDVPGLLTADPRVVPDARVVLQLHVREAAELAYYGAKVLYPRALIPLGQRNIAIRIRSFADPSSPWTEISRRRRLDAYPAKASTAVKRQGLRTGDARDRGARVRRAAAGGDQRHRDRPRLVRAEHLGRRGRARRRARATHGARRLPAFQDRRRRDDAPHADGRHAARLRTDRPRARGDDREAQA